MLTIDPKNIPLPKLHAYLQGVVAPRPIALASTVDREGNVNLSPFSFFNLFSSNPPILVFSPSRRGRDNTTKHTYENILEVPEVVINIVNYNIVQQVSLSSTEYPKGVNEFVKSGLTQESSAIVKPPRVKESPAAFECKVNDVIQLGSEGGAGNLVICEVLLAHFSDSILDAEGRVDVEKVDLVGRMGYDYYCRAHGSALFTVPKPNAKIGIGYDQIPEKIRNSKILTGNDLGQLGNIEKLPADLEQLKGRPEVQEALLRGEEQIHRLAQAYLQQGHLEDAWRLLLL
ncbi:MAG TPA: flavin reductase family protein [Cyclobacteriaceae bacterium]|nr:flavin reductase family protein [Cyclobacteriaceae bacterium]